ncbi:MAG: cation transporter [Commensalibacter sp.]|nr:cation transporter [Commensalibacter sp.]
METYHVKGMTCQHCVRAVTEAIKGLPNVEDVQVDLESGVVKIKGNPDKVAVKKAIEEEGYTLA